MRPRTMKTKHSAIPLGIKMIVAFPGIAGLSRPCLLLTILMMLACFTLPKVARAQCITTCNNDRTAFGYQALPLSSGSENSAFGDYALFDDSSGSRNTAVGGAA